MGIYKRYETRRRKARTGLWIWIGAVLFLFALTAIFGYALGKKAKGVPHYTLPAVSEDVGGAPLSPTAEQKFHGIFVGADGFTDFSTDDPDAYATFWLYRDGSPAFASETDRLLGNPTDGLPAVDFSALPFCTSALFEVGSLYAEESIREVRTAYERALLREFSESGIDEIVLCFADAEPDRFEEMLAYAGGLSARICVCVPYTLLSGKDGVRFFTAAEKAGCPVVLDAEGLDAGTLRADLVEYGFYFTRYRARLLIPGESASLADVLSEGTAECWQFCSACPSASD